jgi:hypothetical protein
MHGLTRPLPARAWLLLLGLSFLVGACSYLPGATLSPREAALRALAGHEAQWLAKGITSYTFSVARSCFCPFTDPVDVTVVDGVVTTVTRSGLPVEPLDVEGVPKTVPELFALVSAQPASAAMTVEWDATFGFPSSIQVDPIANATDDEFGIIVTNFRPAS